MRIYNIFLPCLLGSLLLYSCFEDDGNYHYTPINEIQIKGFGNSDSVYNFIYLADTLRINPIIKGTLDTVCPEANYEYLWEIADQKAGRERQVISTSHNLEFPVSVKPGKYNIYYRVKDKESKLVVSINRVLNVTTSFSQGFLVFGDREDGTVQLDMIAMLDARNDTVVIRDLLRNSGVPEMRNAVYVCHTGYRRYQDEVKLWVMSESGAYFMDGESMTGGPSSNFNSICYTFLNVDPKARPILEFPQIAGGWGSGTVSGYSRGYVLNDGTVFWDSFGDNGEYYGNPINRITDNPNHLLKTFPYVFYALGRLDGLVTYDQENERFVVAGSEYDGMMKVLYDNNGDLFPWNQGKTGRTLIHGDNTWNTIGGRYGRSYALMEDKAGDYFIYAFYVDYYLTKSFPSAKLGYWKVKKQLAPLIDQATHFLFSSSRSLLYYVVGSKIYCYDFETGYEQNKELKDFGSDEITWLGVDFWTEGNFNKILVGAYNSLDGGTLRKFSEPEDQNKLEWTEEKGSVWSGFPKIKSVSWRNSPY